MKTIVCGPPHSGKSIFISNLVRLMPSESFQRITANGDGEGTWSNNSNQSDVMAVRIKGSNTSEDFAQWRKQIQTAKQDIVLVDIGGRLQDDKGPLFDACDSFIVVSNSEDMIKEWIAFGKSHNCKCIATVLSILGNANDTILSTTPYLQTTLSGLERGHDIMGSKVLQAVAGALVSHSGYKGFQQIRGQDIIDLYDIGRKLGCYRSWLTSDGIEVYNIWYTHEKAPVLYQYLRDTCARGVYYRIYGAKSIWVTCIAALALEGNYLAFYDEWTDCFVSPLKLNLCVFPVNDDLSVKLEELNDTSILVRFETEKRLSQAHLAEYQLPRVDTKKVLFVSGRFPNWFVASVMMSYDNAEKYIHIPGTGYVKVCSSNNSGLGTMVQLT